MGGREQEAHAGLVDAPRDPLGGEVEPDPGRLQHVGAARAAGDRAVAVLRDPRAGSCRDERARGGDVERAARVAAGATGVDEVRLADLDPSGEAPHHRRRGRDLLDRLALHRQAHQEAPDLRRRALAGHDGVHDAGHLRAAEVASFDDGGADRGLDVHGVLSSPVRCRTVVPAADYVTGRAVSDTPLNRRSFLHRLSPAHRNRARPARRANRRPRPAPFPRYPARGCSRSSRRPPASPPRGPRSRR